MAKHISTDLVGFLRREQCAFSLALYRKGNKSTNEKPVRLFHPYVGALIGWSSFSDFGDQPLVPGLLK